MVDFTCTVISNIEDKIKRLSLLGVNDVLGFKQLMSLIIINDMIEWAEHKHDSTAIETLLVKLRNHMISCFSSNIKPCVNRFATEASSYVNVNTPQTNVTWDRGWDNLKNTQVAVPKLDSLYQH